MSAISGDKAKFNPQQKNKIARRTRTRATLKGPLTTLNRPIWVTEQKGRTL
jgi:hypothetical protein